MEPAYSMRENNIFKVFVVTNITLGFFTVIKLIILFIYKKKRLAAVNVE